MDNNIKISRIQNKHRSELYQDVSPLQENLLDQEEIIYYNCGINTVSEYSQENMVDIREHHNIIENHIMDVSSQDIENKIKSLTKQKSHTERSFITALVFKNIVYAVGGTVSAVTTGLETYSIIQQNSVTTPHLNVDELIISCFIVGGTILATKILASMLKHYQNIFTIKSKDLNREITKLEIQQINNSDISLRR